MSHKPGTKVVMSGQVGEITGAARRGLADGYNVWTPGGGLPHFVAASSIRLAVVGDTVCAKARHSCQCPLVHTSASVLAELVGAVKA